jgi:hypothetical protein
MIYKVTFWRLDYPKGYVPGMGYKKTRLGSTYISEFRKRLIGIEAALWQAAARLRLTCAVDAFDLCDATGEEAGRIWFCGSMD